MFHFDLHCSNQIIFAISSINNQSSFIMLTLRQISLAVSAILVSVCLASCGGDDDEPQYTPPVVTPGSNTSEVTDEPAPCITPDQMCGNWVLVKAVTTDGLERLINLPFSLSSVELMGSITSGQSLFDYNCAFSDNEGLISAKAVTRTEGVLDYITQFSLVLCHELDDVFIEVSISEDAYHLSGDKLVISGTYSEVNMENGHPTDVALMTDAYIYLERRN